MTTLNQKLDVVLLPNDLAREQQKRDVKVFKEWLSERCYYCYEELLEELLEANKQ